MGRSSTRGAMLCLAIALGASAVPAESGQRAEGGLNAAVPGPVSIRSEMARRPPDVILGATRIWHLSATATQRTAIIEMSNGLPRHLHPDGAHYLYVVEGGMTVDLGERAFRLRGGDYLAVPTNTPHAYHVPAGGHVILLSVDAPPYDPARTVWLDAPPGRLPR